MKNLKSVTVSKSLELLGNFINEVQGMDHDKGLAVLALNQLKRVTAGGLTDGDPLCIESPQADITPGGMQGMEAGDPLCIESPQADISPNFG